MRLSSLAILFNLFLISSLCDSAPTLTAVPVKNSKMVSAVVKPVPLVVPYPNDLKCDACEYIASALNRTVFHNNKLLDMVEGELSHICDVLPASVHDICLVAVNNTVPELVDKLGNYVAEEGCTELGICHSEI
jgi:hypothetical protein